METEGGTSKGACCVFPFVYHGTQYFGCTDDENKRPWCATTSNYDIDGMWGHCLGKEILLKSQLHFIDTKHFVHRLKIRLLYFQEKVEKR